MKDLESKVVLITGGAMGMGRELASLFLDEGSRVIITDINPEKLNSTLSELSKKGDIKGYVSDVSDIEQIRELKNKVHRDVGKLDILVNNAGIVFGKFFKDLSIEEIKKTIDVDLYGVIFMTKIFFNDFLEKESGHIVNIASAAGLLGVPKLVPYCTAKFGVVGFSETLRLEVEELDLDIKVTAVCPSYVATGMFEGAKPPRLTKFLSPEKMAKIILEGVKKNRSCVIAPAMAKMVPFFKAIFPSSFLDNLNKLLGVSSSMNDWKGHSD